MKKGSLKMIYEDPRTKLHPEGKARLVERVDKCGSLTNMQRWTVTFLSEPERVFERWIYVGPKIPEGRRY